MDIKVNDKKITDKYAIYNADTTELITTMPDESMDFVVYSPPFANLYCYSNSDRDLGNSRSDEEFFAHFDFIVKEMFRILRSGRIMAVHCMQIPAMKERDG
jgi:tRNA1(Val) A37 N6-methylase TrmN6